MSYGRLNIWLRFLNCELIPDCWRTDLVIKACCGKYLIDMDPSIIERLQERYPGFTVKVNRNYQGADRILIQPTPRAYFNHIEVDIPPGCYVIWTRICHGGNEETNKVMAIVDCGQEVCVNLLLNDVETCGKEFVYPFLERAAEMKIPAKDAQVAAKAIMKVARKPDDEMAEDLEQRMEEVRLMKDKKLLGVVGDVQKMFGGRLRRRR